LATTRVPVKVSVDPEPEKVIPVVPPVKVNAAPVRAPPLFPVIEIEDAAGDWNVGADPVLPVKT
jgi:hypothetical protein